jgi:predicted MFS family arabinose efflux permease
MIPAISSLENMTRSPAAGVPALRLVVIALTAFLTVVDLFAAQALLPSLVEHYGVTPAAMGLAVNACTFGMAIAGFGIALFGRTIEPRRGMLTSLVLLSIPTALLASAPNLWVFAALRFIQGIFMVSAFCLMLAHLSERFAGGDAASAFSAYITGNVASNLIGRLISAGVVSQAGLPAAFYVFSALNIAGAALDYLTVQRLPGGPTVRSEASARSAGWADHLADADLRAGFAIGFCILFAFIGTFTFVNFVLTRPPLSIGMMQLGLVYFVFLPSIVTTPLAGLVTARLGVRQALLLSLAIAAAGLPLLLSETLPLVLLGLVMVAAGTFAAQAQATGFVSATAMSGKAAASGIYLASYFLGGLAGTAVLGPLFDRFGWAACVAGVGVALLAAMALTLRVQHAKEYRS